MLIGTPFFEKVRVTIVDAWIGSVDGSLMDSSVALVVWQYPKKKKASYESIKLGEKPIAITQLRKNYVEDRIILKLVHKKHENTLEAYDDCKKENSKKCCVKQNYSNWHINHACFAVLSVNLSAAYKVSGPTEQGIRGINCSPKSCNI